MRWQTTSEVVFGSDCFAQGACVSRIWRLLRRALMISILLACAGGVQLVFAQVTITGTVFEDKNYGGDAGRSLASSSGTAVPSARVELYNAAGNYTTFTTTDASGNYTFSSLAAGTYTVRVVNGTVNSSRTGTEVLPPVQTYRTDASSGAAVAVTDRVGGEVPGKADAGNGSTTLAALTTGTTTAQSITSVVLGGSNITGVEFGYSYNVIVNKNNTGQGSLRQFLLNANALSNAGLAQSGLTAGIDNAVFMLADGTARPGLTASYATMFVSSIATVAVASELPSITDPVSLDATLQSGYSGTPMIELNGTGTVSVSGLKITAGSSKVSGFIINRFESDRIHIATNGSNTITANYIGTNAAGTAASRADFNAGIYIGSANNIIGGTSSASRNIISGNTSGIGISIFNTGATGNTVQGNYIGLNAAGSGAVGNTYGITIDFGANSNTIGGTVPGAANVISGNSNSGVLINNAGSSNNTILGNYIGTNAAGTAAIANVRGVFITASADNNTIGGTAAGAGNLISGNGAQGGVIIDAGCTGNAILNNSIYGNTGIGIDLLSVAAANNGTKTSTLANSGMDSAVFTTASLSATTLTLAGYVGSAASQATFASATVQVFKSDLDATGFGEGQTLLGTLTADASGNFSGTLTVSGLAAGDKITGTATDATNNTSEFGANAAVTSPSMPPNVPLVNSVAPSSPQPPGTDLVYTVVFTNDGGFPAQDFIVIAPIPTNTDFKLGSQGTDLATTGLTVAIDYSNDNASTWTYTPVSGAGGAPTGYDRLVTHVRWRFTGNLSQTAPNNTGSITFTARIR